MINPEARTVDHQASGFYILFQIKLTESYFLKSRSESDISQPALSIWQIKAGYGDRYRRGLYSSNARPLSDSD